MKSQEEMIFRTPTTLFPKDGCSTSEGRASDNTLMSVRIAIVCKGKYSA